DAARWIGLGDNHADDGIFDARYQVFWYACLGSEPTSSEMVRNLHFPTFAKVPNPPDQRIVEPGGTAATRLAQDHVTPQVRGTAQEREFRLRVLGEALHVQQDSWSPRGEADTPIACNAQLAGAHPKARGGWRSHKADHTWWDLATAMKAARQTYD